MYIYICNIPIHVIYIYMYSIYINIYIYIYYILYSSDPGPGRDLGSRPGARAGTPCDFPPIGLHTHAVT